MKTLFELIQRTLKEVSLRPQEKRYLKARLMRHMKEFTPGKEKHNKGATFIPSPYAPKHSPFFTSLAKVLLIVLIVSISGTTSAVMASAQALPGDTLYPFKVNFVEEIKAALKLNAETRIKYEVKRAENRLEEATKLALTGKLDHDSQETIIKHIEDHTETIKETGDTTKEKDKELQRDAQSKIESSFKAHSKVLSYIEEDSPSEEILALVAVVVKKAEEASDIQEEEMNNLLSDINDAIDEEIEGKKRQEITQTTQDELEELTHKLQKIEETLENDQALFDEQADTDSVAHSITIEIFEQTKQVREEYESIKNIVENTESGEALPLINNATQTIDEINELLKIRNEVLKDESSRKESEKPERENKQDETKSEPKEEPSESQIREEETGIEEEEEITEGKEEIQQEESQEHNVEQENPTSPVPTTPTTPQAQ